MKGSWAEETACAKGLRKQEQFLFSLNRKDEQCEKLEYGGEI